MKLCTYVFKGLIDKNVFPLAYVRKDKSVDDLKYFNWILQEVGINKSHDL